MIQLSKQHLRIIFNHAQSSYPEECCGVILGNISNSDKIAVEIIPTENAWNSEETVDNFQDNNRDRSKKRRYAIAPRKMLELQKSSREKELNIIGIFHSHPTIQQYPQNSTEKMLGKNILTSSFPYNKVSQIISTVGYLMIMISFSKKKLYLRRRKRGERMNFNFSPLLATS